MFRRKEQPMPAQAYLLNGRYVKVEPNRRGGYADYKRDYEYIQPSNYTFSPRGISETDISESYLSERDEQEISQKRQDFDKLNKSNRRKIPFLQKKRKDTGTSFAGERQGGFGADDVGSDNEEENDDISDITTYNEGIPVAFERKNGLNTTGLNQAIKRLDLDHQYAKEVQIFERMNYILENYRPPPAYPGQMNSDNSGKSMIQQLLQEKSNKQIKDNASMINYCQVDAPKDAPVEDRRNRVRASPADPSVISPQLRGAVSENLRNSISTQSPVSVGAMAPSPKSESGTTLKGDKLVMRTLHSPLNSASIAQNQFNFESLLKTPPVEPFGAYGMARSTPELISEIYPRDYDTDNDDDSHSGRKEAPLGSKEVIVESSNATEAENSFALNDTLHSNHNYIVDVMPSCRSKENQPSNFAEPYTNQPGYHQHPERDYDLPDRSEFEAEVYEPDVDESHGDIESSSDVVYNHSHEQSETYVPPSPYMYAEIPEWLQVYAKASPELDDLLKWDMFRLPELDCWQTMLKRLYMKELEQIVFWFEEYRQAMQHEMERRELEMGIMRVPIIDQRMKKTDV